MQQMLCSVGSLKSFAIRTRHGVLVVGPLFTTATMGSDTWDRDNTSHQHLAGLGGLVFLHPRYGERVSTVYSLVQPLAVKIWLSLSV
jgi:hypothetical protein